MPPPIKKKKSYHASNFTKKKCIDPGSRGLFFTCEGHEKQAVSEARNLIDKYSNAFDDAIESDANEEHHEDVSEVLNKMCQEATSSKTRFPRLMPVGVKNCLFFEMSYLQPEELYALADRILAECQTQQQCRYLQRVLPIEETCSTEVKSVSNAIAKLVQLHFNTTTTSDQPRPTYAIDFKARNNDQLSRTVIFDMIETALQTTPGARVNLTSPDFTFIVHVSNKTVMLACPRDFMKRRKFSLHAPVVHTE